MTIKEAIAAIAYRVSTECRTDITGLSDESRAYVVSQDTRHAENLLALSDTLVSFPLDSECPQRLVFKHQLEKALNGAKLQGLV